MLPAPSLGDTIVAVATGPVNGAVSLIRIAGPKTVSIANAILRGQDGKIPTLEHRRTFLSEIRKEDSLLDKPLVTYFRAPASFTGDDVLEISCHGSPFIVRELLALITKHGARPAGPGEFSMRAFLNGKIDLAQAEGLCALIKADSSAAHRAALGLTEGAVSGELDAVKNSIVDVLAESQSRLDDADEEMAPADTPALCAALQNAAQKLDALAATYRRGRFAAEGVKIAIVGAPNSGKSSLLNALAGYNRAIVSPTAGTTRDTIEEHISIGELSAVLTDTAGIRDHALDPAEQEGMERTRAAARKADMLIFVADASHQPDACAETLWHEMRRLAHDADKPLFAVLNKTDVANRWTDFDAGPCHAIAISCKTGNGLELLRKELSLAAQAGENAGGALLITSERHFRHITAASAEIRQAGKLFSDGGGLELCAVHLNAALRELGEIVGETTPDDILGVIFSKFCVGK